MPETTARTAEFEATMKARGRRHGAISLPGGAVGWRVWAPRVRTVELVLMDGERRRARPMQRKDDGSFHHVEPDVPEGQRYAYRLDGGPERPDPCSLWQPEGVHGPSAVVHPERFAWSDRAWQGIDRADLVFYELHVGTFTPAGTFEAILPRLPALRELGITAVELMPVAQFPGTRNWGYDGVQPYAAQDSYGGPHGLQRLVNACHAAGLAVFLDVVYNHLGPEGNYLAEFGPYFTDCYKTPWGQAVNFDGPGSEGVREFVLDNACMWLEEFHFDGLRLDAVHAVFDLGARPILRAVAEVAERASDRLGRPLHVIAESDLNDPRVLLPPDRGGSGLAAQWSDDFHHAVHAYLTGERQGYYTDFGTAEQLARVLERPFLYAGDYSPFRGRKHGAPPDGLTGDRFVVCLQNHDQVGNRARGERLTQLLKSPAQRRLAASLLLLSPYLPLLFMGEEYGEENPFPFFCSFGDTQLVQAVREGRRREFADFAWQGEVPDPHGTETFAAARLSWSWPEGSPRDALRRLYGDLLTVRRQWPALRDFEWRTARLLPDATAGPVLELVRGRQETGVLRAYFNLEGQSQPLPGSPASGQKLVFSSEAARYGGPRRALAAADELLPYECRVYAPSAWKALV
jgi:maltooligosyltrehalose trehalohydrolase